MQPPRQARAIRNDIHCPRGKPRSPQAPVDASVSTHQTVKAARNNRAVHVRLRKSIMRQQRLTWTTRKNQGLTTRPKHGRNIPRRREARNTGAELIRRSAWDRSGVKWAVESLPCPFSLLANPENGGNVLIPDTRPERGRKRELWSVRGSPIPLLANGPPVEGIPDGEETARDIVGKPKVVNPEPARINS